MGGLVDPPPAQAIGFEKAPDISWVSLKVQCETRGLVGLVTLESQKESYYYSRAGRWTCGSTPCWPSLHLTSPSTGITPLQLLMTLGPTYKNVLS